VKQDFVKLCARKGGKKKEKNPNPQRASELADWPNLLAYR